MNEEIKEILSRLKDSLDNPVSTKVDQFTEEAYDYPNFFYLDSTTDECRIFYDYITNLQEENERLKEELEGQFKDLYKGIQDNNNEYLEKTNKLIKELQQYKSRNKKAIEYIKENEFYLDYKTGACIKGVMPLLNILQGSDKK